MSVDIDEPTFASLNLPEPLLRAALDLGFTVPTPIQARAIPLLLAGRDITGVAQTGTGKTAAFGLPLLAAVDPQVRRVQGFVLTPTRELALQVADALSTFAAHLNVSVTAVYGGAPYLPQIRALEGGAQVVVGTPGRIIDHLDRGTLVLDHVAFAVLDEADEMLRMGFAEDVERILDATPAARQVALFSATMPAAIRRVADHHLNDPVQIAITPQATTVTAVEQSYAVVPFRHKTGALLRVLATSDADATIVFTRTRSAAEEVGAALIDKGVSAATISGDVAQKDREKIVERLRSGQVDVLVATDVAARGLDVERVGLVVNFDLPREPEAYVHRIGRTGRAGRTGKALSFVAPHEKSRLTHIERTIRAKISEQAIPSPVDVSAHKAATLLGQVPARVETGRLNLYTDLIAAHAEATGADPATIAAALMALAVGDDGPRARAEQEQHEADERLAKAAAERPARTVHRGDSAGTRYRLAVGSRDGVQPGGIVGALTGEGNLRGSDIGKVDIFGSFTLVDINAPMDAATLDRLSKARVAGRFLRIRPDIGAPRTGRGAPRTHAFTDKPAAGRDRKPRHRHIAGN